MSRRTTIPEPYAPGDDLLQAAAWSMAATAAGAITRPGDLEGPIEWVAAQVPGTVAGTLSRHGRWSLEEPAPLHDRDYWYRCTFAGSGAARLTCDGLATVAEVWLNGALLGTSRNMFAPFDAGIALAGVNELHICFRSLDAALAVAPARPRARWRPRMIGAQGLRNVRSTLIGHMPGWCPPVHAIGPWRDVRVVSADCQRVIARRIASRLDGADGVIDVSVELARPCSTPPEVGCAGVALELCETTPRTWSGQLTIPAVERWWPHTHGEPRLHEVSLTCDGETTALARVGFRTIKLERGEDGRGFALSINDVPVFCRGAVWSSADIVGLRGDRETYAPALLAMREAGLNMVRVPGTMAYEADAFYDLCDELGILVWQDFMFANMDYPADSEPFRAEVEREAAAFLSRTSHCASLAVLCGGSEVYQQATMLGYTPASITSPVFEQLLPRAVAAWRPDVPYVANSPGGGALPFSVGTGVAHYFGVGAYLRDPNDARRADVRFASECLAFAAIPEPATLERDLPVAGFHHPRWKARTPRDAGASWDFEDVRDHYLALLYDVDPRRLRTEDPDTYMYASRAVLADLFETVMADWRRPASRTAGALVLMLQDLWAGAGWGLLDSRGEPKSTWYAMRRAWPPTGVALTDEGLDGLGCHVVNEGDTARELQLRLRCLRDGKTTVIDTTLALVVPARGSRSMLSSEIIGSFFDITAAYRFGPPSHDVTILSLLATGEAEPIAQAFHVPSMKLGFRGDIGLVAGLARDGEAWHLTLSADRFARRVFIDDRAFRPSDNYFHLDPELPRRIRLTPRQGTAATATPSGEIHALNARDVARYGAGG
jgi:beta-mannosidase